MAQSHCIDKYSGLKYGVKRSMAIDEIGRLIIATAGVGLAVYDGYDFEFFNQSVNSSSQVYDYTNNLYRLDDGSLICANEGRGTIFLGRDSSIVFHDFEEDNTGLYHDRIESYLQIGDTLLVGTRSGDLSFIDLNSYRLVDKINLLELKPELKVYEKILREVFDIEQDISDPCIVWIVAQGLFKYNLCTKESEYIPQGSDFVEDRSASYDHDMSSYGMYDIVQYDKRLYLSSWGGGLISYDIENDQWDKLLIEDYSNTYVFDENVLNLLNKVNDTIVYAGGQGYLFYDMKNQKLINDSSIMYGQLKTNTNYFNLIEHNNRLFHCNTDECCIYKMKSAFTKNNTLLYPPYIKDVFADGISLNRGKGIYPKFQENIEKDYRNILIDVRLPLPYDVDSVEYQYKLEGLYSEWYDMGSRTTLQFDRLVGGSYSLHIRARDLTLQQTEWLELEEPFNFSIEKFYFEEVWFKLLIGGSCVCLVCLIGWWIFRVREQRKVKEINHLIEIQKMQLTALRAQMNPHFIFNSLSSINDYVMHEEPRKASKYLTKFSHLMRRILNNSSKNLVPLEEELLSLQMYTEMENVRFGNRFQFVFDVDSAINTSQTYIPTMILQPFVENAIHHGLNHKTSSGGKVFIYVSSVRPNQLNISIEDNGIGREKASAIKRRKEVKNSSKGIQITRDRMDLIKNVLGIDSTFSIKDLVDDKGDVCGTVVKLSLPLIIIENRSVNE